MMDINTFKHPQQDNQQNITMEHRLLKLLRLSVNTHIISALGTVHVRALPGLSAVVAAKEPVASIHYG